jgi:SAM-dependent methyltransferase
MTTSSPGPAAQRWRDQLAAWAIPEDILASAPVSPWGFSVGDFTDRAERQRAQPTPAHELARAALGDDGRVLDVGCGGGAGSLPLVPPATALTGVDASADMLAAYRDAALGLGVEVATVQGTWPADAGQVADDSHDVVVAQDVLYNVPDAAGFLRACDRVASRRVVVVLPMVHPMSWTAPYWRRLHDLDRPDGPTVDDALAVLAEVGITAAVRTWREPTLWWFADREAAVAMVRTRLCLPSDRDDEVRAALEETPPPREREAAAVWWDVRAG